MAKAKTKPAKKAAKPTATKKAAPKQAKKPAAKPTATKKAAPKTANKNPVTKPATKPVPKPVKSAKKPAAPAPKPVKSAKRPAAAPAKPTPAAKPASTRAKTEAGGWVATGREWGPGSHLDRALELHRAGKLVEAREAYERSIASEDSGTFPKLQLLQVLDDLGDMPAVLALVDELKGRGRTGRVNVVLSPVISTCEAHARLVQEDFAAAEVAAREGIDLDANGVEAWRCLAIATAAQDRVDDAIIAIERVVALAPDWVGGHFMRGMYLHRAGRTPEAAGAVARATELEPTDADSWYNLACYRALLGDKPAALYALAAAIRIDPSNAETARDDGDFASLARDRDFAKLTA